jgi:hypothetical protein
MPPFVYGEPSQFTIGDTLSFRKILPDYPPSEAWALSYSLRLLETGTAYDISATTSGQEFVVNVSKTITIDWSAGTYAIQGHVTDGTSRFQVYDGFIEALPDVSTIEDSVDLRSHARKVLENIESVLEGRATNDVLDSHIGETSFRRLTPQQLMDMRNKYLIELQKEEAIAKVKQGKRSGRRHLVRFGHT